MTCFYGIADPWQTLAEAAKKGVESSGKKAIIYQVAETLPEEVLSKMHAPPKRDYAIANNDTLKEHDAFLFGIPTRYGNMPAQFKVCLYKSGIFA